MRTKRLLGPALIMAILITSIPVAFSNGNGELEPGYSPGYWKHQCKAYVYGRGHLHEDIETLAGMLFMTVEEALEIFTTGNNSDGTWTDLGNLFNWAAGYGPYEE